MDKREQVYEKVVNFFISNGIRCGEDIYQRDLTDETNMLLEELLDDMDFDADEEPEQEPIQFYFTFGLGTPMKDKYQVVVAPSYDKARHAMSEVYSDQWAFMYSEEEFMVSSYFKNLKPLPEINAMQVD